MGIYKGDTQLKDIALAGSSVNSVYLGSDKIWPSDYRPVGGASYINKSYYFGAVETANQGSINFSPDGKNIYFVGEGSDKVHQYTLQTARDISTIQSNTHKEFSTGISVPNDLQFSPDGTKMYIEDFSTRKIRQHTLSTARDISTATSAARTTPYIVGADIIGMRIGNSGNMLYTYSRNGKTYQAYSIGTARDISTTSRYTSQTKQPGYTNDSVHGIQFSPDGTQMFVVYRDADEIRCYKLTTARNVETMQYKYSISVNSQESDPMALGFSDDGKYLYVSGYTNKTFYMYETSKATNR